MNKTTDYSGIEVVLKNEIEELGLKQDSILKNSASQIT